MLITRFWECAVDVGNKIGILFIYLFDLFKFLDFIKPNIVKDDEEKGFQ